MPDERLRTAGKFSEEALRQLRATLIRTYRLEPDCAWLQDILSRSERGNAGPEERIKAHLPL
jgi:hypothetical protein